MQLAQLLDIMQQLREKCPWDRAQTPTSLTRYAIEEAYEVEEAVQSGEIQHIREELGDLLLQVVFQSQMYAEQGAFDFYDVMETLAQKLIRRHPHVFQAEQYADLDAAQVAELWQKIKTEEKQAQRSVQLETQAAQSANQTGASDRASVSRRHSRLDQVKAGPALQQAAALQDKASEVGFDFANASDALEKLEEELAEFKQACEGQQSDEMLDELGDCLFSLVNVGRKLNLCSETALRSSINKFKYRFGYIEDQALQQNIDIESMSLTQMDLFWEQAKQQAKREAQPESNNKKSAKQRGVLGR